MAKFRITSKDPDYIVSGQNFDTQNLSKTERAFVESFLEWDEYITIEFDTTAKTARVVPVAE
jgi:hypothetical protein